MESLMVSFSLTSLSPFPFSSRNTAPLIVDGEAVSPKLTSVFKRFAVSPSENAIGASVVNVSSAGTSLV